MDHQPKCMEKVKACYESITDIMRIEVASPHDRVLIVNALIKLYRQGLLQGYGKAKCGDMLPDYVPIPIQTIRVTAMGLDEDNNITEFKIEND